MPLWSAGNREALHQRLTHLAKQGPGSWSFSVREAGQVIAEVDAQAVKPGASTIKVALLLLLLQDVAAGQRRLDEVVALPRQRIGGSGVLVHLPSIEHLTVAEAAELMITVSDNEATRIVLDLLGPERITAGLAQLGVRHTRVAGTDLSVAASTATTAADQTRVLQALSADLLPAPLRTLALEMLLRQQFNSRMPARLGPDVLCRHKTGELLDIRHDVGIVEFDDRMICFAALGSGVQEAIDDDGAAVVDDIIARAARTVVDAARAAAVAQAVPGRTPDSRSSPQPRRPRTALGQAPGPHHRRP